MSLDDFVKLLRTRWITIGATALVTVLGAVGYTLAQTPHYQASTRLYVSTTSGAFVSDLYQLYQGNRLSQERVLSYTQLIMGQTLAQRTIDRLNLDTTATSLKEKISSKSKPNTVLIDVSVLDPSPTRARDIANALSDEFVVMVRELETSFPGAQPDARVIVEQRAGVPQKPVLPKRTRTIGFGLVLGLVLGTALAFLRDLLDRRVKSPESAEDICGSSVIGGIPFDKRLQTEPAISFSTDDCGTAEAFRVLRTNLQFLAGDHRARVIVITSPSPNEGKTTLSINIALVLAEAAHNVVLVDGDLRRPRVANYLGLIPTVGLSTVLSGRASLAEALQTTKHPRLSVLTSGATPQNPSELLGSLLAIETLRQLRDQFDYVIVDSSPLLAVTDPAVLTTEADGTLIAVRAGTTRREHLAHAVRVLQDVGANLLGVVLTMMPVGRGEPYAYNNYFRRHQGREK